MIRTVKNTFAFMTAIALCGVFSACGEEQSQPQQSAEKKQPPQQEQQESSSASSTFSRTTDLSHYSSLPAEHSDKSTEMQTAEVKAESLQPVPTDVAAAQTKIRRNNRSTWKITGTIAEDSLAGQVRKNTVLPEGKCFVWTPQPVSGNNLAPFRVPDIKLSPDSSLLVFLETLGETSGPYGSRLILMSTSTWQVLNVLEFRDRYFEKFEFIPGTTKIAALCLAQNRAGQKRGFACFDLLTGTEEHFQQVDPGIGNTTFLVDSNQNLIVSHPKRPALLVLPFKKSKSNEIRVAAPNSLATLSTDGKELAVLTPKHGKSIEIFRTSDWVPVSTQELTETTNASSFYFAHNPGEFFICGDPDYSSSSTFVRKDNTAALAGVSSGRVILTDGGKKIFHLLRDENKIEVLDGITRAELQTIEINKAKPSFRKSKPGQVTHLFYIPSCNGLAMFDDKGHFFLIPAESTEKAKGQYYERAIIFQQQMEN